MYRRSNVTCFKDLLVCDEEAPLSRVGLNFHCFHGYNTASAKKASTKISNALKHAHSAKLNCHSCQISVCVCGSMVYAHAYTMKHTVGVAV